MRLVHFVEALFRGERWAKRRAVEGLVFVVVAGLLLAWNARYF